MPKKALNIANFSGGLNNNTTERDLEDNQFSVINNLDIETPGKIKTMGEVTDVSVGSDTDHIALTDPYNFYYGNGLLHLNLDKKTDASPANTDNTEYLFINDPSVKKIRMFNYTDSSITSAASTQNINYGSTAANVEYLVIDGEIRVSPWLDASTPFPTNNRIKKLKFLNSRKRLGVADAGVANAPDVNYNKVYKTDDGYIAPIKARATVDNSADRNYGYPDGYGYDVDAEMGTSWFHPDHDSEATCNTTFAEADIDDSNSYWVNKNAEVVSGILDGHSAWGTSPGFGGIELAIWTGNTTDANSSIYNWYHTGGGTNPNSYEIFASNIYGNQESVAVHIGTPINQTISGQTEDKKVKMNYCLMGRVPNKPTQTGIKFYWARRKDGEIGQKYLLFEIDFEKGYRKGGDDTWNIFYEKTQSGGSFFYVSNSSSHRTTNQISSIGKQLQEMPEDEPYVERQDTAIGRLGTGYKTSTVVNRRAYVGNVAYFEDKKDSYDYITVSSDTVLKSPVNEFDYFPLENKIDVEINDGEDIIKLASVGDKLLEFKQNTLYIINCSRDIEYLEGKYKYKGVAKPYHVMEGEGFVAWINQYGAYIFDGQKITNLILDQVGMKKITNWKGYFSDDNNVLGYIPHIQTLVISNKNGKMLFCDLKTFGWSYSPDKFPTNDISNMVNINTGDLLWYEKDSNTLKLHKWTETPVEISLNGILLQTKEYTFDSPDVRKKIHSVYVNHKHGTNIDVYGYVDGKVSTLTSLLSSGQSVLSNTSSFGTQHLPVSNSYFKNVRSFGLAFKHDGDNSNKVNAGFELNDIQVVYREKTRK